jgi:glycosidase
VASAPARHWDLEWARGAVFYEVFVRSFIDTDGDGKGDLRGLIEKLDYLNDGDPKTTNDLGVDGLWLMPVFASPSYHGYDVTDYEKINSDYGTNEDFARLLEAAHKRGMKVIVDLVLNHTSSKHPWFLESASSPKSPRRDWYIWRADNPGWTQPWGGNNPVWHSLGGQYYYGVFWSGMPDLNFRNEAVRAEARRIASFWLDRGLDGFRLDATRHLVETGPGKGQSDSADTHASLKEFAAHVRRVKPDALLVGENWTDTDIISTYYGDISQEPLGDELPMSFNFPLAAAIVDAAQRGEGSTLTAKLEEVAREYPKGVLDAPFLTNHDMRRVATQLAGDKAKLRVAAALLLTLPGTPFLYYGEEVGLLNGSGDQDESKRSPMPWDDASDGGGFTTGKPWYRFSKGRDTANVALQTSDPKSLLSSYRRLIHARKNSPALRKGSLTLIPATGSLFVFLREDSGERILVAHNLGTGPAEGNIELRDSALLIPILEGSEYSSVRREGTGWHLVVPPYESAVWRVK